MLQARLLDYRQLERDAASAIAAGARGLLSRLSESLPASNGHRPEAVALTTCHRLELYTHQAPASVVERALVDAFGAALPAVTAAPLRMVDGNGAANHLMRVAAGLESMILGESEIQGQVVAALERASQLGTAGPVLSGLFRAALHTGKRARTETAIARHATSLAPAAIDMVAPHFDQPGGVTALVLGAGTMATRACERIRRVGFGTLLIANRTASRAQHLAAIHGGTSVPWADLKRALVDADVVVAATGSPQPIVGRQDLTAAIEQRTARGRSTLHVLDLGLPHNVDPAAHDVAGVSYHALDALEQVTRSGRAARAAEVPRVEAIITVELERFDAWYREREVAGTLRLLGEHAAAVRDQELQRALRRMPELSARERRIIESLAHNVATRLLREPMKRVRAATHSGAASRYAGTLHDLFTPSAEPAAAGDDHHSDSEAETRGPSTDALTERRA